MVMMVLAVGFPSLGGLGIQLLAERRRCRGRLDRLRWSILCGANGYLI